MGSTVEMLCAAYHAQATEDRRLLLELAQLWLESVTRCGHPNLGGAGMGPVRYLGDKCHCFEGMIASMALSQTPNRYAKQ